MAKRKTAEDIVNDIQKACSLLGWAIAMDDSKDGVSGLVIGRSEFVEEIIDSLDNKDDFSIYQTGEVNVNVQ